MGGHRANGPAPAPKGRLSMQRKRSPQGIRARHARGVTASRVAASLARETASRSKVPKLALIPRTRLRWLRACLGTSSMSMSCRS